MWGKIHLVLQDAPWVQKNTPSTGGDLSSVLRKCAHCLFTVVLRNSGAIQMCFIFKNCFSIFSFRLHDCFYLDLVYFLSSETLEWQWQDSGRCNFRQDRSREINQKVSDGQRNPETKTARTLKIAVAVQRSEFQHPGTFYPQKNSPGKASGDKNKNRELDEILESLNFLDAQNEDIETATTAHFE